MSRKGDTINLDDVLDFYLAATDEGGRDTLTDMIMQYPQFERELRDVVEFRKSSELAPDHVYSADEEELLKGRAVSAVQNVLYHRRNETNNPVSAGTSPVVAAHDKQRSKGSTRASRAKAGPNQKVIGSRQRARRHFARAVLSAEIVHQHCTDRRNSR